MYWQNSNNYKMHKLVLENASTNCTAASVNSLFGEKSNDLFSSHLHIGFKSSQDFFSLDSFPQCDIAVVDVDVVIVIIIAIVEVVVELRVVVVVVVVVVVEVALVEEAVVAL